MTATSLETFRALCPEFEHVEDPVVTIQLTAAAQAHDPNGWGSSVYVQAMCYYAAHVMKQMGVGLADELIAGETGKAGPVINRKAGDLAEGYGAGGRSLASVADGELMETVYGRRYLQLRKGRSSRSAQHITIPIT